MLGEIAGVGIYQSKGKKGGKGFTLFKLLRLWYNTSIMGKEVLL